MRSIAPALVTGALLLATALPVWAGAGTTRTWTNGNGNGSWNTAGNWSPNGVPGTNDVIQVGTNFAGGSNANITLATANGTANTVNVGTYTGTLNLNAKTLSVGAGDFNIIGGVASSLTLSGNGGTLSGDLNFQTANGATLTVPTATTVTGALTINTNATISISPGITFQGNLDISASAAMTLSGAGVLSISGSVGGNGDITFTSTGELRIGGNWTNNGALTAGAGTMRYNGGGNQTVGTKDYNILIIDAGGTDSLDTGTATVNTLTVNGTLAVGSKTLTINDGGTVGGTGTITVATNGDLNVGASTFSSPALTLTGNTTVNYNGSGAQTVRIATYENLTVSTGGTKSLAGPTTVNGTLTCTAPATLDVAAQTLTVASGGGFAGTGTLAIGGAGTLNVGPTTFSSPTTVSFSATSTVVYNRAGNQTARAATYGNFTASGSGTKSLGNGTTTVGGTLSISSTVDVGNEILTVSSGATVSGAGTLNVGNNGTLNYAPATFTAPTTFTLTASSTVDYNRAGDQTMRLATYGDLTCSGSGTKYAANGTVANGVITISSTLDVSAGNTFTAGAGSSFAGAGVMNVGAAGTFNNGAMSLASLTNLTLGAGSTVAYNRAAGTQDVRPTTYSNLSATGGGTKNIQGLTVVDGTLTVSSTLAVGAQTLTVSESGSFAGAGTLTVGAGGTLNVGPASFAAPTTVTLNATSTVVYNRAGAQTVRQATYGNLTANGSGVKTLAAGTTTAAGAVTANSTLDLAGQTLSLTNIAPSIAGTGSIGSSSGVGTVSSGVVVTVSSSGTLTLGLAGGTVTFGGVSGAVTVSSGTVQMASGVRVNGALTANGSLNLAGNTLTLAAGSPTIAGAGSIGSSSGTGTVSAGANVGLSSTGTLTVGLAGGTTTFGGASGAATVSGGAVQLGGATTISGALTVTATLNLAGQSLSLAGGVLAGAGTVSNSAGTATVSGAVTVSAGATLGIDPAGGTTIGASGAWTLTGSIDIGATGTFSVASLGGAGNLTFGADGTVALTGLGAPFTCGFPAATTGEIAYTGAGNQTVRAGTYFNLGCGGTGTKSPAGDITVVGTLTVASGPAFSLGNNQQLFLGNAANAGAVSVLAGGTFRTSSGAGNKPTVTRDAANPSRFTFTISGTCDIDGLNFSYGDSDGLHVTAGATVTALRNVAFTNASTAASSAHVRLDVAGVTIACAGCSFDTANAGGTPYNVMATGAGSFFTFATQGGGAGASEDFDSDDDNAPLDGVADGGGAVVNWVYAIVDISGGGATSGFPQLAMDYGSWTFYSLYVAFRDVNGTTDDWLAALDANGNLKYTWTVPQANGDIVGAGWWTTEGGLHYVYFGTDTGYVYRLRDDDVGQAFINPDPVNWPFVPDGSGAPISSVTSEIRVDDTSTNMLFGATEGAVNRILKVEIATRSTVWVKTVPAAITAPLDGFPSTTAGTTYYFGTGGSNIYRTDDQTGSPVDSVGASGAISAPPFSYWGPKGVFVGDSSGIMNGVGAWSDPYAALSNNWPYDPGTGSAVTSRVNSDFIGGYVLYWGDLGGRVHVVDVTYTGRPSANPTFTNGSANGSQTNPANTIDASTATFGSIQMVPPAATESVAWRWDFGSAMNTSYKVKWQGVVGAGGGTYSFVLAASLDGAAWTTIATKTAAFATTQQSFSGNYRYARVTVTLTSGGPPASLTARVYDVNREAGPHAHTAFDPAPSYDGGAAIESSPWIDGSIYVGNDNGKILVIDPTTAALKHAYAVAGAGVQVGDVIWNSENDTFMAATSEGTVVFVPREP